MIHELLEERILLSVSAFASSAAWFAQVEPTPGPFQFTAANPAPSITAAVKVTSRWIVRLTATDTPRHAHLLLNREEIQSGHKPQLQVIRGLGAEGLVLVETSLDRASVRSRLQQDPNVKYFERDRHIVGETTPNDSEFPRLDGLKAIQAPEAWDSTTGSHDVVVAVIDTGIDLDHPDLYRNVWLNQNEIPESLSDELVDIDDDGLITFADLNDSANSRLVIDRNENGYVDALDLLASQNWADGFDTDGNGLTDDLVGWDFHNHDNDPSDDHRHGTHVAGTIGAIGNNELGVTGVNWETSMMALKVLDDRNRGLSSEAILAVNYATTMRSQYDVNVRVTNNSFVGNEFSAAFQAAIDESGQADILFVAAAGNGDVFGEGINLDTNPRYPASYGLENMISVASSNSSLDGLASFSNYGQAVHIAAPGIGVLSTQPALVTSSIPNDPPTGYRSGTSMSAPHVAGAAALLFSSRPQASMSEVREAILLAASPNDALLGRVSSGGILDAAAALAAPTFAPSASLVSISRPELHPSQPISIVVEYSDDDGVDISSIDVHDIEVVRSGFPETPLHSHQVVVTPSDTTLVRATYQIQPPRYFLDERNWDALDDGAYEVTLKSGQVSDLQNRKNASQQLGPRVAFQVDFDDDSVVIVGANGNHQSLREAISNAGDVDDFTIVLAPGTYSIDDEVNVSEGKHLSVVGLEAASTIIDGRDRSRIFYAEAQSRLTIAGLTLTGGFAADGGAVRSNGGDVSILSSRVVKNSAIGSGGGIWSTGILRVAESTVAENATTSLLGLGGGGIFSDGSLFVDRTTISGNTTTGGFIEAGGGAGVFLSEQATAMFHNSTISGNHAAVGDGGGIYQSSGAASYKHVTVTDNEAALGSGGGIYFGDETIDGDTLRNSIVAGNRAAAFADLNSDYVDGTLSNLIGEDPQLGPLRDNSGTTWTHAVLSGSPVLEIKASGEVPNVDQRGIIRPRGQATVGATQKHFVELRGSVFHDADGDGERESDEPNLAGWTVFVDVNKNGRFDPNEPSAETTADNPATDTDESEYLIDQVDPLSDDVPIMAIPKAGFIETGPQVPDLDSPLVFEPIVKTSPELRPVFHLDFSARASELVDAAAENVPIDVRTSVVTSIDDPSIEGPVLANGRQLFAGQWLGAEDDSNAILINQHPILDEVSRTAGSIVTWINVDNEAEWNGILVSDCEVGTLECSSWRDGYSPFRGFELSANDVSGVFGSVQGWNTNNFGPAHSVSGGPGGSETPSGVWTHVALTWNDLGDHTIFVNGVPGKTVKSVGLGQLFGENNIVRWNIGGSDAISPGVDERSRHLRGRLADFAIFNDELDQQAVNDIRLNGVPRRISPVFHLDFSARASELVDAAAENVPIDVRTSVVTSIDDPSIEGPVLANGRQLFAGQWLGAEDDSNAILINQHPILDEVSRTAGSIVTWINVDNEAEWNGILVSDCEVGTLECSSWRDGYSPFRGFELSANDVSGVFGSVQGWNTNNFGPAHSVSGGPGGSETPSGVWTHVALTWNDLGDHTIFVNGVPGKTVKSVGLGQLFGENNIVRWNIGGSDAISPGVDERSRHLRGRLADFAIFNDELDQQAVNDIRLNGVLEEVRMGVQSFRSFNSEPSVVGRRVVFEDHLGQLQLAVGNGEVRPLIGLNTKSETSQPITAFGAAAFDGQQAAFAGAIRNTEGEAIFIVDQFGAVDEVIRTSTQTSDGTDFRGTSFDVHAVDNGLVAFGVLSNIVREGGLVVEGSVNRRGLFATVGDGRVSTLIDKNTRIQDGADSLTFDRFGEVELDGGTFAFRARSGDSFAIYVSSGRDRVTPMVGNMTAIPGADGSRFTDINSFSLSNGRIAFHGVSPNDQGIYIADRDNAIEVVANTSTRIPGHDFTFNRFDQIAFDQGNVAFIGMRIAGPGERQGGIYEDLGIYFSSSSGNLQKLVGIDSDLDVFKGRVPVLIDMGPEALSGNRLVFYAAFDDGSQGIFSVEVPAVSKHIVRLDAGSSASGLDFGRQPVAGEISGITFFDVNLNGERDGDEPGLEGWNVFIDQNENGLREDFEPISATDADGLFRFSNVPTLSSYVLRQLPRDQWTDSVPPGANDFRRVELAAGAKVDGIDFGNRPIGNLAGQGIKGTIHAEVFHDENGNGIREADEEYLGGRLVFADVDDDGLFNRETDLQLEEIAGVYRLEDQPIGSYKIRIAASPGESQTSPLDNHFINTTKAINADSPVGLLAKDVDGNGSVDFVFGNLETASLTFIPDALDRSVTRGIPSGGNGPISIAPAHLDKDGHLDLAVANFHDGTVTVLLGEENGGFGLSGDPIEVGSLPTTVLAEDLDQDGDVDLVATALGAGRVRVLLNDGNANFQVEDIETLESRRPAQLMAAELNQDSFPDLIVMDRQHNSVFTLLNQDASFTPGYEIELPARPSDVITARLNADEFVDVAVASRDISQVFLLIGNGDGTFERPRPVHAGEGLISMTSLDVDGDDDVDLALTVKGESPVLILRNDGLGQFQASPLTGAADFDANLFVSVTSADVDMDGDQDFVVLDGERIDLTILQNTIVDGAHRVVLQPSEPEANVAFGVRSVNHPPVFVNRSSELTIDEDSGQHEIFLTDVSPGDGELQDLRFSVFSDDSQLIPDNSLMVDFEPNSAKAVLRLQAAADAFGETAIRIELLDAGDDGVFDTTDDALTTDVMKVVVRPVNDPPTVDAVFSDGAVKNSSPITIAVGSDQKIFRVDLPVSAGPLESNQPLSLSASTSNPQIVPRFPRQSFSPQESRGSLHYFVDTSVEGSSTISVTIEDGGLDHDLSTRADNAIFAREFVVTVAVSGDADLDGDVDFDDFLRLVQFFGATGARWDLGDFDGDKQVTFDDFLLLAQNFSG